MMRRRFRRTWSVVSVTRAAGYRQVGGAGSGLERRLELGKISIARCLQRLLGPTWMTLGDDDLVRALPGGDELDDLIRAQPDGSGPAGAPGSIEFGLDGCVTVGEDFRRAEASWYAGLAAMGRCGTGLILDEVFWGRLVAGAARGSPGGPCGVVGRGPLRP